MKPLKPRITPQDLRTALFSSTLRGYNPVEVDSLLERTALELERLAGELASSNTRGDTPLLEGEAEPTDLETRSSSEPATTTLQDQTSATAVDDSDEADEAIAQAERLRGEIAAFNRSRRSSRGGEISE